MADCAAKPPAAPASVAAAAPMPALLGTAAPAFDEPGVAIQLQTAEKVQQSLHEGVVDGAHALACDIKRRSDVWLREENHAHTECPGLVSQPRIA